MKGDDCGLGLLGVYGAHDLSISRAEFSVFVRVLRKLELMGHKKRRGDRCWRALGCLVFVVTGKVV